MCIYITYSICCLYKESNIEQRKDCLNTESRCGSNKRSKFVMRVKIQHVSNFGLEFNPIILKC